MMTLQKISPSPLMREYIRHYEYREIATQDRVAVRPLPARPEQLLQFHLLGQFEVFDYRAGRPSLVPSAIIVGPQTYRVADLLLKGRFLVFVIVFQPTGFHRLFGLPMGELTDRACEASDLIGSKAQFLHERLHKSTSLREMVRAAEDFLLAKVAVAQPFHPVQNAAAYVLTHNGQINLDSLVLRSGLSQRQFERKFTEQVGVSPKLYSRIVRLNYALRLKQQRPNLQWTDVTYEAGYFDQMHLVKDFKSLAGETPSRFLRMLNAEPDVLLPTDSP
jgi:AraC-like DNA-binding protein